MAIDYVIDYDCVPKQTLSTEGILERLKGDARAREIIRLFRVNGDERPPAEMGFEFTRSTPEGEDEKRVIVVQDLLDQAEELRPLEGHCQACPANRTGQPFGCTGFIQYPITAVGESWLLDRLPVPDEALVWLLLKKGVEEFQYDGESVKALRAATDTYFESNIAASRRLGEFTVDANQVFEMVFAVGHIGHINPNHAGLLLLFFNVIRRDINADEIMHITPAAEDAKERFPFLLKGADDDDRSVHDLKGFFRALYMAWSMNLPLRIDA